MCLCGFFLVFALGIFLIPHLSFAASFVHDTNGTLTTGLVSYWNMEGNSNDFYGSNSGTDANVTYGSSYGKGGQGADFNGSNSKINLPNASYTGSAFTFNAWVAPQYISQGQDGKIIDIKGTDRMVLGYFASNNPDQPHNTFFFAAGSSWVSAPSAFTAGTWYMVTGVYNGSSITLYINGVFMTSTSTSGSLAFNSSFEIGNEAGDNAARYFQGNMDEVGFWSKALSAQEIADLYNGGAGDTMESGGGTVTTKQFIKDTNGTLTTGLASYYPMEGNSDDFYGSNNGGSSNMVYGSGYGKVGEGADFNGSTSDISINGSGLIINPLAFSIAIWTNFTASNNSLCNSVFSKTNSNIPNPVDIYECHGVMVFIVGDGGSYGSIDYDSGSSTTNTWQFWTFTNNNGNLGIYLNGTLVASGNPSAPIVDSTNAVHLGVRADGTTQMHGYKDEIGIWNKVLSTQEITDLYDDGAGDTMIQGLSAIALNQYKSDATTPILAGATTTESTVVFGATLGSTSTNALQLQVEAEPVGTSFIDLPDASSTWVSSGNEATATFEMPKETVSNGGYHWQARVMDSTGATSTWQTFGSSGNSTDFVIHTVPLYTQEESSYPSDASTTLWASQLYDNSSTVDCGQPAGHTSTIAACGCAITDFVMWSRYFGITTNVSGTPMDPGSLNTWLTEHGGYDTQANVYWSQLASSAGPSIAYDNNSPYGTSMAEVSQELDSLLSSSTPDPVILKESDGGHYVLATGFAQNAETSTYTIRDPYWYDTQYLNQSTSTNVRNYNNIIQGLRVYYDPPQLPKTYEYHVNAPNTLMLVDSQGRRTGKDPVTGIFYHEIPGTSYSEDGMSATNRIGDLIVQGISDGQYTLYVLGGKTGSYWVGMAGSSQTISGNIHLGSMAAYSLGYAKLITASSGVPSFQGISSSTASITTVPANNLPPPPQSTPSPPAPTPIFIPSAPSSTPVSVLTPSSAPLVSSSTFISTSTTP